MGIMLFVVWPSSKLLFSSIEGIKAEGNKRQNNKKGQKKKMKINCQGIDDDLITLSPQEKNNEGSSSSIFRI